METQNEIQKTLTEAAEIGDVLVAIWLEGDGVGDPSTGGAVVGLSRDVVRIENMQGQGIRDIEIKDIVDVDIEHP